MIYSFGVIHHTPHPERVLEQLRQYARPGTTLKIMVYHRRSWKVLGILLGEGRGRFWKLPELVARNSEAQTGCPITYSYTREEGRKLLEQHGFQARAVEVEHIFPYRIEEYVLYRYCLLYTSIHDEILAAEWKREPWGWAPRAFHRFNGKIVKKLPGIRYAWWKLVERPISTWPGPDRPPVIHYDMERGWVKGSDFKYDN